MRKAKRYIEYQVLASIPDQIQERIRKIKERKITNISKGSYSRKSFKAQIARLGMNEFMLRLEVALAWRQRNLRDCRISGPDANLFKRRLDPYTEVFRPQWVVEELKRDPKAEFWQYRFSAEETKAGHPIHAILPHHLVQPLEDYLRDYRGDLLKNKGCDRLFVNTRGGI